MVHHSAGLARLVKRSKPEGFVEQLQLDYRKAQLSERERALLDYADKLTRTPARMVESDLDPMRQSGLSDEDILDANITVGYFAYVNRLADGLGVQVDDYRREKDG